MRFLMIIGAVAFSLLALFAVPLQRVEHRRIEAAEGCGNELNLIDLWKAQFLVSELRQDGRDMLVKVDWHRWATTQRQIQVSIGEAAYCPLALEGIWAAWFASKIKAIMNWRVSSTASGRASCFRNSRLQRSKTPFPASLSRSCGASKSISGPTGTIFVGFTRAIE